VNRRKTVGYRGSYYYKERFVEDEEIEEGMKESSEKIIDAAGCRHHLAGA
jgi:hypothetical protein